MFLKNKIIAIFIFISILSCQPVEIIKPFEVDISKLEKISINAKEILLKVSYNSIFSEENIEELTKFSPLDLIVDWNNKNINNFGNENKFLINIIDASITKKEIENIDAKKYEEKTIFLYEIFYLVEYELYDSSDFLISTVTVESSRSTTSQKYISLNETEIIINNLILNSLNDFIAETKTLLKMYMGEYIQ